MKKILTVILALALVLGLCACGATGQGGAEPEVCQHSFGQWEQVSQASQYTPDRSKRVCTLCGLEELQENCDQMFRHYASILRWLPFFTEAQRLQQNLESVITAAFFEGVPYETEQVEFTYYHTITVDQLDAFTQKVLGCTYDYSNVSDMPVLVESVANYDAEKNAIVISTMGAGLEPPVVTGVSYESTASGSYMVTAQYSYDESTWDKAFCVTEKDGSYVISTH